MSVLLNKSYSNQAYFTLFFGEIGQWLGCSNNNKDDYPLFGEWQYDGIGRRDFNKFGYLFCLKYRHQLCYIIYASLVIANDWLIFSLRCRDGCYVYMLEWLVFQSGLVDFLVTPIYNLYIYVHTSLDLSLLEINKLYPILSLLLTLNLPCTSKDAILILEFN